MGRGTGEMGQRRRSTSEPKTTEVIDSNHAWEKHLPASLDDRTVKLSIQAVFHQADLHVENFYGDMDVPMTEDLAVALEKVDSRYLPDSVVSLIPRSRAPTALIKHCLIQLIVSRISVDGGRDASFLPSDLVILPSIITAAAGDQARKRGESCSSTELLDVTDPATGFDQAYSHWRVLSAYLRPDTRQDQAYLSKRDAKIAAVVDAFSGAFAPWLSPDYSREDRRRNLTAIMRNAAETGISIFAQPSTFRYEWSLRQGKARDGNIVVTPAFLKIGDEGGHPLERAQVMVEMVTQSL